MSRLIDADEMYQRYCVEKHGLDGIYDTTDLSDMLAEMPTVDAIPMEWLENRLNTLCFESMGLGWLYNDRIGELAKSINEVMKLWQREQEGE